MRILKGLVVGALSYIAGVAVIHALHVPPSVAQTAAVSVMFCFAFNVVGGFLRQRE